MPPCGEEQIGLLVAAPGERGRYLLELDLVQQDVAWFSERRKLSRRRTRTALVEVDVGDAFEPALLRPVAAASDEVEALARMEIYAIPRHTVIATLAASGAEVSGSAKTGQRDPAGGASGTPRHGTSGRSLLSDCLQSVRKKREQPYRPCERAWITKKKNPVWPRTSSRS